MDFAELMGRHAEWMVAKGPSSDIVVTSRVRLARNLTGHPFPGWAARSANAESLEKLLPAVEALPGLSPGLSCELAGLGRLEKRVLVERHLISREHASRSVGSAVVINASQSLSVMVNEEDHLRLQAMLPGLDLEGALQRVLHLDEALERTLQFAYDPELGYLTACPSNLGTGLRASAMLHLPGLMLTEDMEKVVQAMNQLGVAVRGLYGEGSDALGNLFQVSNQRTLGKAEKDTVQTLDRLVREIIGLELLARLRLLEEKRAGLCNQIGRAYGILRFAHRISSTETLGGLSHLRLASDLGFFGLDESALVDALMMEIQPAHVQWTLGEKLPEERRDEARAEILRGRLKSLPAPDMGKVELQKIHSAVSQHLPE
ncbi:MAG TPA: ATP--guanido phosphotransferase [Verrucomicrobiales bacterium]|nr:ATP--guanido phosphotransferase [Verrucomicrobiales bacterium]